MKPERDPERIERQYEALFENSPDMIATHDAEGVLLDVNQRLADALGYSKAELLGKRVWDVDATVDPAAARSFWMELPSDEVRKFEGTYQHRDGSTFPVEIHLVRLEIDGEDQFLAFSHDTTDRKERERRLERQNERLEEFSSVVSHDLRNPLNVAQGRLELASEECDSGHLEDIERAHDRMEALIEDLLTLAREGETQADTTAVDLARLSENCWQNVETGTATLVTDLHRTVRADEGRLKQLLENLIRNSVEHGSTSNRSSTEDAVEHSSTSPRSNTPEDAVEHSSGGVTVTIGELDDGFYVEDDGPGIPPEERDRVFETGYSTSQEGTGFGLSIVRQIVDAHGWDIRTTDGTDGGARFEITGVEFAH